MGKQTFNRGKKILKYPLLFSQCISTICPLHIQECMREACSQGSCLNAAKVKTYFCVNNTVSQMWEQGSIMIVQSIERVKYFHSKTGLRLTITLTLF